MEWLFKKIISIYSVWPMLLTLGIGLFTLLNESEILKSKNFYKEAKWAKRIGYIYIFVGGGLYLLIKILY